MYWFGPSFVNLFSFSDFIYYIIPKFPVMAGESGFTETK
jgi:hypothetical protein